MAKTLAAHNRSPRGFTLVELLVVIGIIALLAALVTPAVMQAQVAARNAAIKAEIDMLHMAIMNYKNEYGSFPPAISGTSTTDLAAKHVLRIFPRTTSIANEVTVPVTPLNSISGWLSGYSSDPTAPVSAGNRQKLYDFDKSRLDSTGSIYYPSGKPGAPYIYINSGLYTSGTWPASAAVTYTVGPNSTSYTISGSTYYPVRQSGTFFNSDTFQILCAGRDEVFGNDDDLSNFWPGTRKAYQDSLSQ
jgi:prepilin-type N-terminal cleavage/methylation domain-containing protein